MLLFYILLIVLQSMLSLNGRLHVCRPTYAYYFSLTCQGCNQLSDSDCFIFHLKNLILKISEIVVFKVNIFKSK